MATNMGGDHAERGPGEPEGRVSDDVRARAERDAFVSHMASVGVTDVVWTAEVGPVGTCGHYNAMLSVEWERFAAGYRAALAVAPATAAHPSSMPPGFDWNPPCPDDAPTRDVLLYALRCAKAWEPGARILGNLRACDLSRALTDTLTAPAPPVGSPETCPTCYGGVRNRPGNVSTEGTRVQLCVDPWHAAPTPPAPRCPKCDGTGLHILADVPGEGQIVAGRCPKGCPTPPAPVDDAGGEPMPGYFTCPKCRSHEWGTSNCTSPYSEWVGHCHNYRCGFSWPREKDDAKYFEYAPAPDAGAAERAVVEALRDAQTLIRHLSQGIAGLVHADDDAERLYFVPKIVAAYGEFNEVATKIDAALRGTKGA